jgi:transitional endoplasmic reticulum ATPase
MPSTMSATYIDDELALFVYGGAGLAPSQRRAADGLLAGMETGDVCVLRGAAGMGKTAVLRWLHAKLGGAFVTARGFLNRLKERAPAAIGQGFRGVLEEALQGQRVVLVDDLHLAMEVVEAFGGTRGELIEAAANVVRRGSGAKNKKLVVTMAGERAPNGAELRAAVWTMEDFEAEDFAWVCRSYLGEASERLDFDRIHRFAPELNAYQLKNACLWLGLRYAEPSTQSFLDYLGAR